MRIWTSYFAVLSRIPPEIVPISITRYPPKGWKGLEYKTLAPPWSLVKAIKETGDTEKYVKDYLTYVIGPLDRAKVLSELETLVGRAPEIVLVCYEKPSDFCHRHIVAEWLGASEYAVHGT